jgi:hypothetical protein
MTRLLRRPKRWATTAPTTTTKNQKTSSLNSSRAGICP